MRKKTLLILSIVVFIFLLVVLILHYDSPLSAWAQGLPDAHSAGTFWGWADTYGEWPTWIVVMGCLALYLISFFIKGGKRYQPYLEFILLVALISPIILNRSLKLIVGRPRPSLLYPFHDSFPSGHTTSAFVLFAFAYLVPKTKPALKLWAGVLLGGWGLLIGVSRVVWGAHYPSDVLAGAFLTLMTEYLLWRWVVERQTAELSKSVIRV